MIALAIDPAIERGAEAPDTDLANALRLAREHGERMRYCPSLGWLAWDGRRWEPNDRAAERLAMHLPALILHEVGAARELEKLTAADTEAAKERAAAVKRLASWAHRSAGRARLADALRLAQALLSIEADRLDADPWVLNVQNGTVDLRTGKLRPHDPADLITKLATVAYDPAAEAPLWEAAITSAMGGRLALVAYVQRALGSSITGDTSEQSLFFAYGAGSNGKSTILGAVLETLGDYGRMAPPDLLTATHGERHPTELADLRGVRMAVCSETEAGRRLAVARLKLLTGEATVTARRMRRDFETFKLNVSLWLQSNHRPEVAEQTEAVWRRIKAIPFDTRVQCVDKKFPEKLRAEHPGILAWLVRGCLDWQRHGLEMPAEVAAAVEEYRNESDALGAFLSDCCELGGEYTAQALPLFEAYRAYCHSVNVQPFNGRQFKTALIERGHERARTMQGYHYGGLMLRSDAEAAPDA